MKPFAKSTDDCFWHCDDCVTMPTRVVGAAVLLGGLVFGGAALKTAFAASSEKPAANTQQVAGTEYQAPSLSKYVRSGMKI